MSHTDVVYMNYMDYIPSPYEKVNIVCCVTEILERRIFKKIALSLFLHFAVLLAYRVLDIERIQM